MSEESNPASTVDEMIAKIFSKYDNIYHLRNTLYCVVKKNEKWGIFSIDTESLILSVEYDRIGYLSGSFFEVKKNEKWGIFSTVTNEVTWKNKNE